MPVWISAVMFAVLAVVVPFTAVLRMLGQLPRPVAASHRRWPPSMNVAVVAAVMAVAALFIRSVYFGIENPAGAAALFAIAVLAYAFGLVLLLRQFCGVYPEFVITARLGGLVLRKTSFRSIRNVEAAGTRAGETRLKVETERGGAFYLVLPTRDVPVFYDRIRKENADD